jgi:hypothetical protein
MKRTLLLVFVLIASCATDPDTETREIYPWIVGLVNSDSTSIRLHVQMEVGPNGCHSFKEVTSERIGTVQKLRFFAVHDVAPGNNCTLALVILDDTLTIAREPGVDTIRITLARDGDAVLLLTK